MIDSDYYLAKYIANLQEETQLNSSLSFSHGKEKLLTSKTNGGNRVFEDDTVNPIAELLSWSHLRNTALRDERPTGSESQNSH